MSNAVLPYGAGQPWVKPTNAAVSRSAVDPYPCKGLSLRRIGGLSLFALGMIFLNKLGFPGSITFFVIVVFMLVGSPLTAVMGMNLGLLGLVANFAFVPKTAVWTLARFVNLFVFAGRFVLGGRDQSWMSSPPYLWLNAFCGVAALCSIASGYYVHIALLKLVSFWLAATGFFAAIHAIRSRRIDTTEWFIAQTVAVCGMCLLSLRMGVGANFKQFAEVRGYYNLAFYHSQTMGPGAAFLATYCACVYLFSGHRNRWICLPIFGSLLYFLSLTVSRTGAGALVAGLAVSVGAAMAWGRAKGRRPRLNLSRGAIVALALLGAVGIGVTDLATGGSISRRFAAFAVKATGEVETVSFEAAFASRQGVAEQSWNNFLKSPVTGIGFQVADSDYFRANATLFTAPVEKGFLPTALLEEVGLLGTSVFVAFVISMAWQLWRERNIPGLGMFVAHLASNLGEASYFAVAGQGGFAWTMFFAAVVLGDRCMIPDWAVGRRPGLPAR